VGTPLPVDAITESPCGRLESRAHSGPPDDRDMAETVPASSSY